MGEIFDTLFLWLCYALTAITFVLAMIAPFFFLVLILYCIWKCTFGCKKK